MSYWDLFWLSLVQGLTEFLPVSSSGHLVLAQKLLGFEEHSLFIDVAVHVGTLLSVLTVYRKNIAELLGKSLTQRYWHSSDQGGSIYTNVVVATVPTVIVGLLFKDLFTSLFSNIMAVGCAFAVTGGVIFLTHLKTQPARDHEAVVSHFHFPIWWALLIGIAQAFAITPGISRSGMTIAAALLLGLKPVQASYFSFLLAVPAILGGAILTGKDVVWTVDFVSSTAVAVVLSYIFGLLGLWSVIHIVKKGNFKYFSYYLWLLSAGVLVSVLGG